MLEAMFLPGFLTGFQDYTYFLKEQELFFV